ncbi:hypothetical protein C6P42_000104 [Pichia californica]|nr:hypothetical protein C6P42_000104 [[Candida] californica]
MLVPAILRKMRRQPIIISILFLNLLVFSLYFTLFSYEGLSSSIMSPTAKFNNIQAGSNKLNDNHSNYFTSNSNKPSISSLLDKLAFLNENNFDDMSNNLYKKLFSSDLTNSNWRFSDHFVNNKISLDISAIFSYVNKRKSQHIYDPRITMTVYLNHLNEKFNTEDSNEIPFSWADWVDLSALNPFLGNDKSQNCYDFFHNYDIDIDTIDNGKPFSEQYKNTYCIDNEDFSKSKHGNFINKNLLPGFNFHKQLSVKSNFVGQLYNAKSYLLSFAQPPTLIYFLSDNGTYFKVKPYQSKTMMENGMFDSFVRKPAFKGFNPIEEILNLNKYYLLHSQLDFKTQMIDSNSYELSIPESRFIFNPDELFHYLHTKKIENLEPNEASFLEGIKFSQETKSEDVVKHFTEVNVKWYAQFHDHEIRENGAHYDFRFFSGFLSEMPESEETTVHSPIYDPNIAKQSPRVDNKTKRQTIILSHMAHTLFSLTFHDGLFMWPAHGSLLAWYFNAISFPYDEDEDVQMPIEDLAKFCLKYNNSMIVENPRYGMGKYFVDCSSSLTHRGKELGNNNIDARVIDIDSGMYIDITGLSVSSDKLNRENLNKFQGWITDDQLNNYPLEKKDNNEEAGDENQQKEEEEEKKKEATPEEIYNTHKDYKIYNCRNDHYYTLSQLSPARLTLFEGAPTFVVASSKSLIEVLDTEYGKKSHENAEFKDWYYVDVLKMWVKSDDMNAACHEYQKIAGNTEIKFDSVTSCYLTNRTTVLSELIKNSVYDITKQSMLKNENGDRPQTNILGELFRDNQFTSAHQREMKHFYEGYEWAESFNDQSGIPEDWESVAKWMLEDHAPPRLAMLDYLIFTEKEDQGEEIHIL